jgi:hypothetical protein
MGAATGVGCTALRRVFAGYAARFDRSVLRHGLGEADTVYGFNGAVLELFEAAKARGMRCIVEQTMAPRRFHDRILREELARWPGWQPDLGLPQLGVSRALSARKRGGDRPT